MALALFQNENSTIAQEFAARLLARAPAAHMAKAQMISELVIEVHKFMLRFSITPEQFRDVLKFIAEIGEFSDSHRHELVLLADVFGLSALVAEISNEDTQRGLRSNSLFAPFYRPDAPQLPLGANICLDGRGEPLQVSGRVLGTDGDPVVDALVEVWHANADGLYENQEPDKQPEFNLRGKFHTDAEGRFHFHSIKPKGYSLPDDGPVGRLLTELSYPLRRPAHINFKVSAPGFSTVTIEYFDRTEAASTDDAMFHLKPELMTSINLVADMPRRWDMVVEIAMTRRPAVRKIRRQTSAATKIKSAPKKENL